VKGEGNALFGVGIVNRLQGFFDLQNFVYGNLREDEWQNRHKLIRFKRLDAKKKNPRITENAKKKTRRQARSICQLVDAVEYNLSNKRF
jgi:hypothetical protein